jgi:hypothetical protein
MRVTTLGLETLCELQMQIGSSSVPDLTRQLGQMVRAVQHEISTVHCDVFFTY